MAGDAERADTPRCGRTAADRLEGLPSMDQPTAATRVPDPDAVEFVRYCYRRRRVGWPELYDEMCAVAGRGLFRGYGADDLADHGIGFSLYDMPALATLATRIVAEEQAQRRPVTVKIVPDPETQPSDTGITGETPVRYVTSPAGA
jgi:hypothetical protein